jgi:Ser/Thr protein kinase RdoA (MazF antagonist)
MHRRADFNAIEKLVYRIYEKFDALPLSKLERGFCHGDFHRGNGHIDDDGTITFFDFDCCGIGWRAYDIAVFRWGARLIKKEQELWQPFISGYKDNRVINEFDENASKLFIGLRHIGF